MIITVEAEVKFATGRVASIEKVSRKGSRVKSNDGLGVIRVILRPPNLPFSGYAALLKFVPTLSFKEHDEQGARFEMWYFQQAAEEEIRKVIHALKSNRHLTRHQELEAYLAFDISYSTEATG
jgi:hypothetical protein